MWAKLDDGWWCHPKVLGSSAAARGVWASVLSWSCAQRTDEVPRTLLAIVGGSEGDAAELVERGLWRVHGDGWLIHDWSEYQEMTLSEKRAEAGRKGGQSKRKQTDFASEANGQAGPSSPLPSHPDPDTSSSSSNSMKGHSQVGDEDERVGRALEAVAQRRLASTSGVKSPKSWLKTVMENMRSDELLDVEAVRLLEQYPDITEGQLVDVLCGNRSVLRFLTKREAS